MTDPISTTVAGSAEYADQIQQLVELQALESGLLLFFAVILIGYFGYKFLRMFF